MKRTLIRTLSALACTAVLASSCYKEDDGKGESAVYGQWMLDTETVIIEASSSGNGSKNERIIDFTGTGCYIELGVEGASARLGSDFNVTVYSYDAGSKRIDFPRGLSVSDDGRALVLAGSYDVTELTEKKMVLTQKSIGVSIGTILDASQTAIFEFHKKEDTAGREKKQY